MTGRDIDASDWTEQDLLTREIAARRLADEEIATAAELLALGADADAHPEAIALLERRLNAVRASWSILHPGA
ncbi:hypothetical protein ACXPWS_15965 [Mycobacterium sp. BMJ-28]